MIPLRDENPSGTFPFVTLLLIAANVVVFGYELAMPTGELKAAVSRYGVVPARAVEQFHQVPQNLDSLILPFLSSMFLHGGFMHLIGNIWYLWIFGDNIEDRLGHFRFLFFYVLCGLLAGAIHVALNTGETIPCIGASGAIAGVLGAYFFCYPGARVLTLVPIFVLITFIRLPASFLLGVWFLLQVLSGTGPGVDAGGVAWWAHIGGFAAGIVLVVLIPQSKKARQQERLDRFRAYQHRQRH